MKIYLFLKEKLLTFSIPQRVSGSFSFDENLDEESKLINIEARNSEWTLYSTPDVNIINGGMCVSETPLKPNTFYTLERNQVKYIVYVSETFDSDMQKYIYDNSINLIIGNDSACNINFPCGLINGVAAKINVEDGLLTLNSFTTLMYLNDKAVSSSKNKINFGDVIEIYGLRIVFFNGFLLINNPLSAVNFNVVSANLRIYQIPPYTAPEDIEVKDADLYNQSDYFSKSPRLRRIIKTKEIDLSPPPKSGTEEELPLLLTIGPMLTMGCIAGVRLLNTIVGLMSGSANLKSSWPSLITSIAMVASMLLWPSLTKKFNKKLKEKKRAELVDKYTTYLEIKGQELLEEERLQREILIENLVNKEQCLGIINAGRINFWDKRIEQNDFLEVRLGIGDELLDVKVNYPEEGFTIDEDELREQADKMVESYKYIKNVPIGYSFYKNKITAIMSDVNKSHKMMNNIILQLITFYSYEDIKIVVFTNEKNEDKWDYLKYLNHSFSNDKSVRFFSSNIDSAKNLEDYLNLEIQNRIQMIKDGPRLFKPYYVVIVDDYSQIKRSDFAKILTEVDANLGFSLIILENQMSKLPSKCNNFISLGGTSSGLLKNSFEEQEQITFIDEIEENIDIMGIVRKISNIPIEFEEGNKQLPEAVTFLEMEKIGKVEQLNIMNRWDSNDSTTSLKAEVGLDEFGNLMYLDLHEKAHGPHGLIAGMTGSGKSEFIITYILSMAINYSPDEVSFILIDYKGGGLAFAFENKTTGVSLPHLAGTITNLDKAEMDRTLVSIDSEIKRRQAIFNSARDKLGESTIDIYKYQQLFKEGKLSEPVPHLFIISDEFAELKSQQPEFMDNLISVARIGRSLGVHLILATQKPSGVVNDQIWSNTKFRVCLKVQDASDSKEMLKRPEAAYLKQAGRFYLQVGYDEYFALGQSGWCGAKYYPSDKIIKQVDKSVNFIDDTGNHIKSMQAGKNIKIEAQGEQLAAIMQVIIEVSKMTNKKSRRLWLNDIEPIILVDNLEKKYNFEPKPFDVKAIIGEYDAPEKQEQGLLVYSPSKDGNTIIFGNDEVEVEKIINTIIYSVCKNYTSNEINIYVADYGSESLRVFSNLPQIGGVVFMGEDEKTKNLFKLITKEIKNRKKILADYNGSIDTYNTRNETNLSQIIFVINNYEGLLEIYPNIYEDIASIGRDCERYGIALMMTCNSPASIGRRLNQCFGNKYAFHLIDAADYFGIFAEKCKIKPRDILGRGLVYNDGIHEFQTASITEDNHNINEHIEEYFAESILSNQEVAPSIPSLPDQVTFDFIQKEISTIEKVPVGILKDSLKIAKYDFKANLTTAITSNKLISINSFMDSLLDIFIRIPNLNVFLIDTIQSLPAGKLKILNDKRVNYFDGDFESVFDKLIEVEESSKHPDFIYIFYGLERLKTKLEVSKIEELFNKIKASENSRMIFCDSTKNLKSLDFDQWYSKIKNTTDGIWIGSGFAEQQNFRVSKVTKEMSAKYSNNYGFCLTESTAKLMKLIEFNDSLNQEDDENDE